MGYTVLPLLPYRCEIKSIEIAWAQTKLHIKASSTTLKINDMDQLITMDSKILRPTDGKTVQKAKILICGKPKKRRATLNR
jgi:transposase